MLKQSQILKVEILIIEMLHVLQFEFSLFVPITLLATLQNDNLEPILQPENWQPQAFQPLIIKLNNTNPFNNQNSNFKNLANPMNSQFIEIIIIIIIYKIQRVLYNSLKNKTKMQI
ncbi:unnamed protein product [Paramecium octaurelia]|nr:unnamed protein product [Paramecium octaurelia]